MWQIHRHLSGTLRRLDQLATAPLSQWQGAPVQVVTAIAKPHVFIDMLQAQGIQVVHTVIRGDHDALEGIEYALKPEVPVLVTAKDAVKLRRLSPEWQTRCWIADLELIFPDSLSSALSHWAHDNLPELSSTHG
jgi:tetraacyldisaccharide-1-P 4'-kinase